MVGDAHPTKWKNVYLRVFQFTFTTTTHLHIGCYIMSMGKQVDVYPETLIPVMHTHLPRPLNQHRCAATANRDRKSG